MVSQSGSGGPSEPHGGPEEPRQVGEPGVEPPEGQDGGIPQGLSTHSLDLLLEPLGHQLEVGRRLWVWAPGTLFSGPASAAVVRQNRRLLVLGRSMLARHLRHRLQMGQLGGWDLQPVDMGATPLAVIAQALRDDTGSNRFYNILQKADFGTLQEVDACPDECLGAILNSGPQLVRAVRKHVGAVLGAVPESTPDRLRRLRDHPDQARPADVIWLLDRMEASS